MHEVNEESPLLNEQNGRPSSSSSETPSPDRDSSVSTVDLWTVVPFLLLGVLISNADITLVIASSQKIASEFDALSDASWLVTSYVLAECAAQPMYGKMSDIFGRRATLIFAYILFALGCFLCGIGHQFWVVLLGRGISGAGGAGMTALVSIIVGDMVTVRSLAKWRSYINIAQTMGRSLGGPTGGILTDTVGWRWLFYGQCPLTAIAIVLVFWRVPDAPRTGEDGKHKQTLKQKFKRIDASGCISLAATIISLLLTLELAGRELSWKFVIIPFILFIVFAIAFYFAETRLATEPVLPIELITKRPIVTSYLVVGLQNSAQLSMLYLIPLYFQIAAGSTVADAGLRIVPAVVGNATGGLLSGYMISKTGRYKVMTIAASAISCVGFTLITLRYRGNISWPEVSYVFFGGFGTGIITSTTFVHLVASLDASEMAIAGTNSFLAQNMSFTVGLQVAITILHVTLRAKLQTDLGGFKNRSEIIDQAVSSVQSIKDFPDTIRKIVVKAYVNSLTWTYVSSIVTAFAGLLVGLTIREQKM